MELLSIPLNQKSLEKLTNAKNLLAFSGGVDSTALFFILMDQKINFDIVIVDYGLRTQSKEEIQYAKTVAEKYHKKIFIKEANITTSNFEHTARKIRYQFFETIIKEHQYNNLITAHQLNDRVEWFFMQMSKGAGVVELLGFDESEDRKFYNLIRPLVNIGKEELLEYLNENHIKYFTDQTNFDNDIKRNFIRNNITNPFLRKYKNGIVKSLEYLNIDKDKIFKPEILFNKKDLYIIKNTKDDIANIRIIDKAVKKLGILLSKSQREEIIKNKDVVISDQIAIVIEEEKIYISPYSTIKMDKKFKEKCRILKIPQKIRPYLYQEKIDANQIH